MHKTDIAHRAAIATGLMLAALPANAQWTGKGEAGLAIADGNSKTRTAAGKIALARKVEDWEHSAMLAGLYVRNDGDTTARRWEAGLQSRYTFGSRNFWYGGARYEEDRYSGFDHQGSLTTGIGRHFIDNDRTKLTGQVGIGYKFLEQLGTPGEKDNSVAGVAKVEFSHDFTATTSVFDKLGGEFAAHNNFLQNEIGVSVKMTDRLALAFAYAVRHNSDPPAGFRKTDTLTTVNLVYEVK